MSKTNIAAIKVLGPVGFGYLSYDDIAKSKYVWWWQIDYNFCRYEAYAAINGGKQPCIVVFRTSLEDDGHGVSYVKPGKSILTVKELQDAINLTNSNGVTTPSKP